MSLSFTIKFCAEDRKDYKYELVFLTEGETFTVPVFGMVCNYKLNVLKFDGKFAAISPRAFLNLPDEITLPKTAVKIKCERSIFIRNIGYATAVFAATTNTPFSVTPPKGVLLPDKTMQLKILFHPQKIGKAWEYLYIIYDTGEKLSVRLEAFAEISNISLEKGSLQFHKTFVGLTRQRQITLTNNSDYTVQFKWKLYPSIHEDNEHGTKIKKSLKFIKHHETIKSNKLETYNIIDADGHAQIYERIYKDEIEEFENTDQFLYKHPNFEIIPLVSLKNVFYMF